MRCHIVAAAVIAALCASTADGSGILAPDDQTLPPLRVTDHLVDVSVHDRVALTTLTQTFRNDTKRRLEATYVFPLPEEADLTDFRMTFNGKMVPGRVLPAEEAARIYEDIVRQSKDPGLIEFIGRRLLQMRIFPIEPESDTTIQVKYQQVCSSVSGMHAYHYPLRTRSTAGQAYGTVRFAVDLETNAPLRNIWSPTHSVEIVRDAGERSAKIAYEANGGSLEDDFLLLFNTDSSDLGLSVVAHRPDAAAPGHFVLILTPGQLWPEEEYTPQDVAFVIDTSGSMAGDKLAQAKEALKFSIDRLDDRDRFTVVRFSTGFDTLFDGVTPADADHRAKARTWIDGFEAAGGTNIADTLLHVLAVARDRDARDERPFVVVFLTDGRGNREPAEIMNMLAEAGGESTADVMRMFPFGVGHDVNTKLLDRLAGGYKGRTTYVQPGESLELRLGDFFGVISRPVLTDLRLALPDIGVQERFPAALGDLYHGQQLIVAGQFRAEDTGSITLSATRGGKRVEYAWPDVSFRSTDSANYVPSVWAGRKIAYLVDQIRTHGESTEMVEEILALSQKYGIQTPYSSWLVDPERVTPLVAGGRRGGVGGVGDDARRPVGRRRGAPGGGVGAPAAARDAARDRAGALGSIFGEASDAPEDAAGYGFVGASEDVEGYGDDFDEIDLALADRAVTESHGRLANLIARKNAGMRERSSRDEGRLRRDAMLYRQIAGRGFHRFGRTYVDEGFGEDSESLIVRFASDAWFEIVRRRPDLRPAFAASPTVVVMLTDDTAVIVSEQAGIEQLADGERERLGFD